MSTILENPAKDFKPTQDRFSPVNSPKTQYYKSMRKGGASNSGNILYDHNHSLLPMDGTGANFLIQQRTSNGSGELYHTNMPNVNFNQRNSGLLKKIDEDSSK